MKAQWGWMHIRVWVEDMVFQSWEWGILLSIINNIMSLHCWVVCSVGWMWRWKEWLSAHAVLEGMVLCEWECLCVLVQHVHVTHSCRVPVTMSEVGALTLWKPGLGSHTGPHHSRQFCLMCMQGRYQERERLCYPPQLWAPFTSFIL